MTTNEIYHAPIGSPYFGFYVTRVMVTPWRYNVWAVPLLEPKQLLASNLRRDEARGMLKLLGAYNVGE